jgi:Sugar (and other) transporter
LLLFGSFGQGVCFLVSGAVLATTTGLRDGEVVVAMIYLYFVIFAFAWQAIPFLYPAEILSLKYRNRFYGLSNGCNWAINYVVVLITPVGLANIGWKFYLVFMIFNFVTIFIVYFFFVETAMKSLEDIDLFFLSGKEGEVPSHRPLGVRLIAKGDCTSVNNTGPTTFPRPSRDEKVISGTVEHIDSTV